MCNIKWKKEHPFENWISQTYCKMKYRVNGREDTHDKGHWKGLPICTREEFDKWANTQKSTWEELNNVYIVTKKRGDAPSINRKISELGYIISNLEIITVSKNSIDGGRKGGITTAKKYSREGGSSLEFNARSSPRYYASAVKPSTSFEGSK